MIITGKTSLVRGFMVSIVKKLHQHWILFSAKLIEISKGTDDEFSHKHRSLYHFTLYRNLVYNIRNVTNVALSRKMWKLLQGGILLEIAKYSAQNYLMVYLDETWYDSHDTVKKYGMTLQKSLIYLLRSQNEKELRFFMLVAGKVL